MFLNSREEFKQYLSKSKKPFMATFYKDVRKLSACERIDDKKRSIFCL